MTFPEGMGPIKKIFKGHHHTFALTKKGDVYAWGLNGCGQLGLGDQNNRHRPAKMTFPEDMGTINQIFTANSHTFALTESGDVYVWGSNYSGQLGLGDMERRTSPVLIQVMGPIKQIFTGNYRTYALAENGQVYAWGLNEDGQLGLGHKKITTIPTLLSLESELHNAFKNALEQLIADAPEGPPPNPTTFQKSPPLAPGDNRGSYSYKVCAIQ